MSPEDHTMTKSNQLPMFERQEVDRSTVRITKAGDGLSEALKVEPKALLLGGEVFYVLRCRVRRVAHDMDQDENVVRVHTLDVEQITEVERGAVERMLDDAAERLQRARDEASGQQNLVTGTSTAIPEDEREAEDVDVDEDEGEGEEQEGINAAARRDLDALPVEP